MKTNKRTAILFFITSVLFYCSAILNFASNTGFSIVFFCLGTTFFCLGAVTINKGKEKNEKDNNAKDNK